MVGVYVKTEELSTGRFRLHEAALTYDCRLMKELVRNGENPNITDQDRRTALHVLLFRGFRGHLNEQNMLECCKTILEDDACKIVNVKDDSGETALSYAVANGFESCASLLVRHGADSSKRTALFKGVHSLATCIAKTMPNVMMDILNSGITMETEGEESSQQKDTVQLNWRPILQFSEDHEKMHQRETAFLHSLADVAHDVTIREEILNHPLVSAFLHMKSVAISWPLKCVQALLLLYPVAYMVFLYYQYFELCHTEENLFTTGTSTVKQDGERINCTTNMTLWLEQGNNKSTVQCCEIEVRDSVKAYLLLLVVIEFLFFELAMLFRGHFVYLKNWRSLVITVSVCVMVIPLTPALRPGMEHNIYWVYPNAAFSMFLSWLLLLIQMQLLIPAIRVYLEMFVAITFSVIKVTLLFLPLLAGFYIGFMLMFSKEHDTYELFKFVLMAVTSDGLEEMLEKEKSNFKFISCGFSIVFIVVVTVVYMNFLLGVSIDDVQKMKRNAEAMILKNSIHKLFIIDLFFPWANKISALNKSYQFSYDAEQGTNKLPLATRTKITLLLKSKYSKSPNDSSGELVGGDETTYC